MAQGTERVPQRDKAGTDTQLRFASSIVVAAIFIAGTYFARPILVPIALAILLAFALAPAVTLLRRFGLGSVLSVLLATLSAIAVIGIVVLFIGAQLAHLAADLPHYERNIAHKIHALQSSAMSNSLIGRTSSVLSKLGDQLSSGQGANADNSQTGTESSERPIPVVIRQPSASALEILENISRPLLDPLATAAIASIFVVFILLQKEDLRDRFIWVAGSGDLRRTKVALDDGASRVSRYLLTQTAVNAVFGALIGTGLWFIGVPNPWLWGVMATILRFIPYVGVPLAGAAPLFLSLAVDPGWSKLFETAVLYFGLEPIAGQVVEPFLYGKTVGLSPVAIVVAATFWTWVWGPVGLLLSMPLTLCLAVLGRHVETLKFLDVLLGNRPPLANEESFYLRILAGDPDDAARLAEVFLKQHSLCEYYDIALKGLVLAQADAHRGALDEERCAAVKSLIEGLIQNLTDQDEPGFSVLGARDPEPEGINTPAELVEEWRNSPVLCVSGRNLLDEAAALLLVDLLAKCGVGARLITAEEASSANIQKLDPAGIQMICLSYLESGPGTNAHYLMKRLRRRIPGAAAIAGFWGIPDDNSRFLDAVEIAGCDVVTTLCMAMNHILAAAGPLPAGGSTLPADYQATVAPNALA